MQLSIHQNLQVLLCRVALIEFSRSVRLSGISSIQMQHLVLCLVETRLVHMSPLLTLVQILWMTSFFCCINCLIQLGVNLLNPTVCVIDKDMEHRSQAEPLVYTTHDQPAVGHKAIDNNSLILSIKLILYPLNSPYFSNLKIRL